MQDAGFQLCTKWPVHLESFSVFITHKLEHTIQYLRFHLPEMMSRFPCPHLCCTECTVDHVCACFVEAVLLCQLSLQCNIFTLGDMHRVTYEVIFYNFKHRLSIENHCWVTHLTN